MPPPTDGAPPSNGQSSGRRLMLVDDNADLLDAMSVLLTDFGFEVATATEPLEALALAPGFRPEVAVLDLGLPVMDGYRLAAELRLLFSSADCPRLIAMSGYGQASDRRRSAAAGFEHHLVKPVDIDDLLQTLRSLELPDRAPTGESSGADPD